jgi:hypothetical protein
LKDHQDLIHSKNAHYSEELGQFYQRLSIPPNSLPLSTLPPAYEETQEDLYRGRQINPRDVSKLLLELYVPFTPTAESKERVYVYKWNESQSPSEFFDSYVFSITVAGIGSLYIGAIYHNDTRSTPEVLQSLLNKTLDVGGRVASFASWDLHGSKIAMNYLCINTKKEWQPPLKAFSIIAGSTIGVFAAFFSLLGMVSGNSLAHLNIKTSRQLSRVYT